MNNVSQHKNSDEIFNNRKLHVPSSQVVSSKGSLTQIKNSKSAPKNRRLDDFDEQYMAEPSPLHLDQGNEMSSIKPHPDIQDPHQMIRGQQNGVFYYAPMNTQEAISMQQ